MNNTAPTKVSKGILAWFAYNPVAANLLLFSIVGIGLYSLFFRLNYEVLPSVELDTVNISVIHPGTSPHEIEQSVTIKVEEAVSDIDGISKVLSTSAEGHASVRVEVEKGYDPHQIATDVRSKIDAITSFPTDIETPTVKVLLVRRAAIDLVIFSDSASELQLHRLAESIRGDIQALPEVSTCSIAPQREFEIGINIERNTLERYGLRFDEIAEKLTRQSVNISSGNLKNDSEHILLRTYQESDSGEKLAKLPIKQFADGRELLLEDIASIQDGFGEQSVRMSYQGKKAILVRVESNENQDIIASTNSVKQYVENRRGNLPAGIELDYVSDRSRFIQARIDTLLRNGWQGAILVFLILLVFVRLDVAFWVVVGIPVSFAGTMALMPFFGVSINMVSAFSFILVLGIVVDDAIVTGENIFHHFKKGKRSYDAVITGTHEIATPVTFGVLTTVAAFIPLLMLSGFRGELFKTIPMIIIPILLFSLIESKLILPTHLRHLSANTTGILGKSNKLQEYVNQLLEHFINTFYMPVLSKAIQWRYLTLSIFMAVTLTIIAAAQTGWVKFSFFPNIESETVNATLRMPVGTSWKRTNDYIEQITNAALKLQKEYTDENGQSSILKIISGSGVARRGPTAPHLGFVTLEMKPHEQRTSAVSNREIINKWRQKVGLLTGVEQLDFKGRLFSSRSPVDIEVTGRDIQQMKKMIGEIRTKLQTYPALYDISDDLSDGKQELKLSLKPAISFLGLTARDLAMQVRHSVYGYKVTTIQRERDEVDVMLRLSAPDRSSINDLSNLPIRTPNGQITSLTEVAHISFTRSPYEISRRDRQRTIHIKADADKKTANLNAIQQELSVWLLQLNKRYPHTNAGTEGEAEEKREMMRDLGIGLILALFMIYALLAIPLKSYLQPIIILSVVPVGFAAAILGHVLLGKTLSIISIIGMLALCGVVVNDSLILVNHINRLAQSGQRFISQYIVDAAARRFRPILLTSLTTFFGLMPLMFEKSTQAQFLIPMAISLGVGILLTTFITLLLIPILYLILEDIKNLIPQRPKHG